MNPKLQEIVIKVWPTDQDGGGYMYAIHDTSHEMDDAEELDGGLCTTTMQNAIEMACTAAQNLAEADGHGCYHETRERVEAMGPEELLAFSAYYMGEENETRAAAIAKDDLLDQVIEDMRNEHKQEGNAPFEATLNWIIDQNHEE